jgi:hypothetical protein
MFSNVKFQKFLSSKHLKELETKLCLGKDIHPPQIADHFQALRQLDRRPGKKNEKI